MPTTDYKRDERIQVIHQCLKNINGNWSIKKILEKVNNNLEDNNGKQVSARTIADDLKYLELKKFAPIVTIKRGRDVYYTYEEDFELNKPIITQDESFSLVIANQILQQLKGFSLTKDLQRITEKLQHQINESDEEQIIFFEEQPNLKNIHYIQDLFECIKAKTVIKLQYQNYYADNPIEKIIHPYLLKQYNQRWFLFGLDEENRRIDNSPLDRIVSFKQTLNIYDDILLIETINYFNDIIGVTKPIDSTPKIVLVKVNKNRVGYIATKPMHHSQKLVEQRKNGDTVFELKIIINKELVSTLLSFGKDVMILKPLTLKKMIEEMK